MIPNPFDRWRAERFSRLLDEAQGVRGVHSHRADDDELVALAGVGHRGADRLSAAVGQVTPDPAYRARLRRRLLAVAHTQGLGDGRGDDHDNLDVTGHVRGRRGVKIAMTVGAVVGVLAVSGIATASGDAVPGDTLYGVKRQTERAQLVLAGSDVNRGQLHLNFARTRLKEAAAVAAVVAPHLGSFDTRSFDTALDDMDAHVREGVGLLTGAAVERRDTEVLQSVDGFADAQRRKVLNLIDGLVGVPRERVLGSLELIEQAQGRSSDLRQNLVCTGENPVRRDELGPLPQRCSAAPTPEQPPKHDGDAENDPPSRGHRDPDPPQRPDQPGRSDHPGRPDQPGKPDKPAALSSDGPIGPNGLPIGPTRSPADGEPEQPPASPTASLFHELERILNELLS